MPRRVGRHRYEIRDPRRATQLPAAGPQPADAPGLLPRPDLLHLDPDAELLGENLDQLAEIDPFVGNVIENSLDLIALVFDVADLHIQVQAGRDLARTDHRFVLETDRLLPLFDVVRFRLAVNFLEFAVLRIEPHALHLPGHHVAGQRHDPDVVSGRGLDGHDVAAFERQAVDIPVITLPRILKAHLENIVRKNFWHALEPVVGMQLKTARTGRRRNLSAALAELAAPSDVERRFRIFIFTLFAIHPNICC